MRCLRKGLLKIISWMLSLILLVFSVNAEDTRDQTETPMELRDRLLYSLEHCEEEIDLYEYRIPKSEVGVVYRHLLESQPQLFYVGGAFSYTYDPQGYLMSLFPTYLMDRETLTDSRRSMITWLNDIQTAGKTYASDGDKALFIHDYLAENFTYSPTGEENYDVYSLLTEGHGVCQAFSLAMIALGRCMELEVDMVTSPAMDHAWNHVAVDGDIYHVDVTRDLPTDRQGVRHERFLLCDSAMAALGYRDYTCEHGHRCDEHRYEPAPSEGQHQGMLRELTGTAYYISPYWLGQTKEDTLVMWAFGGDTEKEEYPTESLDLNRDGRLSLADILLPTVQKAPPSAMPLTDALRRCLMRRALSASS